MPTTVAPQPDRNDGPRKRAANARANAEARRRERVVQAASERRRSRRGTAASGGTVSAPGQHGSHSEQRRER
jgi:hypothetical protein